MALQCALFLLSMVLLVLAAFLLDAQNDPQCQAEREEARRAQALGSRDRNPSTLVDTGHRPSATARLCPGLLPQAPQRQPHP